MRDTSTRWIGFPLAVLSALLFVDSVAVGQRESESAATSRATLRKYQDAKVLYEKARVRFDKREMEAAEKDLVASLQIVPTFADSHFLLSKIRYMEKSYPEALIEIQKAKEGHVAAAALWDRAQRESLADRRSTARDNTTGGSPSAMSNGVQNQQSGISKQRQNDEDSVLAGTSARSEPPAAYFYFHGNILLRMKRDAEAAEQYREALRIEPTHQEAVNNLAALYFGAKDVVKAREVVEKAEASGVTVNPELKKAIEAAR